MKLYRHIRFRINFPGSSRIFRHPPTEDNRIQCLNTSAIQWRNCRDDHQSSGLYTCTQGDYDLIFFFFLLAL